MSLIFNLLLVSGIVLSLFRTTHTAVHDWGYHHGVHPDEWGNIYPTCNGKRQSPVDIKTRNVVYDRSLYRFNFYGLKRGVKIILENNGHSVQVDLSGSNLKVTGGSLPGTFTVDQCHFHWGSQNYRGSEHEINGRHFSMEMHVVMHSKRFNSVQKAMKSENGFAVLGFFIDVGDHNSEFDKLIHHLKEVRHKDDHVNIDSFYLTDLFPSTRQYYRYYGSLTTPPCYESVIWTIFKDHIYISQSQLNEFRALGRTHFKGTEDLINNYRNPQHLNGRVVKSNFHDSEEEEDEDEQDEDDD